MGVEFVRWSSVPNWPSRSARSSYKHALAQWEGRSFVILRVQAGGGGKRGGESEGRKSSEKQGEEEKGPNFCSWY